MTRGSTGSRSALLLLVLTLASCADTDPLAPPTVYFGEDVCAVCGMIISDARFAAAAIVSTPRGHESRLFDDIGCLLQHDTESPGASARWVRDLREDRWLPLDSARFVHSRALRTPMAFGVAATATSEEAKDILVDYPGDVLDLEALRERYEADALGVLPEQSARIPTTGE